MVQPRCQNPGTALVAGVATIPAQAVPLPQAMQTASAYYLSKKFKRISRDQAGAGCIWT
jgi:hypothetical protein